MSISKTEAAKNVLKFIVGTSTSFTVRRALINNVDPKNKREKLELTVGSFAMGGIAAEASDAYIDRFIEAFKEAFRFEDKPETNN